MSHYLFPDTTVLRNFAVVGELDLLERMLGGRGRWTEAVAYEVERSVPHAPALRAVEEQGWLGEPIEVSDPAEMEVGLRVLHDMRAAGRPVRPPVSTEDLLR